MLHKHLLLISTILIGTSLELVSARCRINTNNCQVEFLFPTVAWNGCNGTEYNSLALAQGLAYQFAAGCSLDEFQLFDTPGYSGLIESHYTPADDTITREFKKATLDGIHDEHNSSHVIKYAKNRGVGYDTASDVQRRRANRGLGGQGRAYSLGPADRSQRPKCAARGNVLKMRRNSGRRKLGCEPGHEICCKRCNSACFAPFDCHISQSGCCFRRNLRSNDIGSSGISETTLETTNEQRTRDLLSLNENDEDIPNQCGMNPITLSTVLTEIIHHHASPHGRPECAMFQDYIINMDGVIYRVVVDDITGEQIAIVKLGELPCFDIDSYVENAFGTSTSNYKLSYGPMW